MNRPWVRLGLIGVATFGFCMTVMSCGEYESNRDVEDKRYEYCVSHGGSFSTDDTDFSCDMPSDWEDVDE